MPIFEFREKKTLKLINVISRPVPTKEIFKQDKQVIMLQNWLRTKSYDAMGPLIIYSSGIKGRDKENNPIVESRIMAQLKQDKVQLELPYRFDKEIRIENCLLVRFDDEGDKLHFATMKLQVFAYEYDIELTGEMYMILIKQEGRKLLADVFMPIKVRNE